MIVQFAELVHFDSWQRRIDLRATLRRTRTPSGLAIMGLLLISAPSLVRMMRRGPFPTANVEPSEILGALIIAQVGFTLAFAAMAWASISSGLVLRFQHAPLRAHPSLLPLAVLHEAFVVGTGRGAAIALPLFYGLHWRLLHQIVPSPGVWAAHAALTVGSFVIVGALVARWTRRTVLRSDVPRRRALRANKLGVLLSIFATFGALAAEKALAQTAPGVLIAVGHAGKAGLLWLIPPLQIVAAPSPGAILMWAALYAFAILVVWRVTARTIGRWVSELPVDQQSEAGPTIAPFRSLLVGHGVVRQSSAFAAKDLVLPMLRSPARHFVQQWVVFGTPAAVVLAMRFAFPETARSTGPVLFPIIIAAMALVQALISTLHLLGVEGRRIALLLPILPSTTLLLLKGAPAALAVTVWTLLDAVTLLLVGVIAGFEQLPVITTILVALIAGSSLGALGVTLGFLFPDFERRSVSTPGASAAGRMILTATGGFLVAAFAIVTLVGNSMRLPTLTVVMASAILVVLTGAVTAVSSAAGQRRLARLEV